MFNFSWNSFGFTTVAPTTVVPVVALNDGGDKALFKNARGQRLKCKHHFVDLGFSFTDFKDQGLTFEEGKKLVVVLNKQTARLDVGTISVAFSVF